MFLKQHQLMVIQCCTHLTIETCHIHHFEDIFRELMFKVRSSFLNVAPNDFPPLRASLCAPVGTYELKKAQNGSTFQNTALWRRSTTKSKSFKHNLDKALNLTPQRVLTFVLVSLQLLVGISWPCAYIGMNL